MSDLVHLHGHDTFSFKDGHGLPSQIADRIQQLGHNACATTNHGNVFSHVPYYKEFKKRGLKPILGLEAYVVERHAERTNYQKELDAVCMPHVTLLARTQRGYRNLLKLSKISWCDGFYYSARIDWDLLAEYQEGLTILSGCVGGWPSRLALQDPEKAFDWVRRMAHRFEQFYIELDPAPSMGEPSRIATETLAQIAWELKIPAVVTADAHFPRPEDHQAQDLMQCVGIGKRLSEERTFRTPAYQYYCSGEELLQRCCATAPGVPRWFYEQAIARTREIADACEVEIQKGKSVAFPDVPAGKDANDLLQQWVEDGHTWRFVEGQMARLPGEADPEMLRRYAARARYELDIIKSKGFADYILAIGDVCRWMKERGTLVAVRGSGGGCLVLWLIGASETDPLRHGLIFERFYDHTRNEPPDVDLDFERLKRDDAIAYIYEKYGAAHCSQVAALSKIKAKSAVQDVCFALNIPRAVYAPLSDALNSADEEVDAQLHHVTDPKALSVLERYPQIAELVPKIIGQYRQQSIHAAGVLVSSEPLESFVGIVAGSEKQQVAAVDKRGAAELGLLKMDFLSVNSLDILAAAVRKIDKPMDWLPTLPLDDSLALEKARDGLLAGIFQLDGNSAGRVCKQIGIDTFEDLVAASGLCRPGPAEWVETYARHKRNPEELERYLAQMHPTAAKILAPTYGILCYQEQVMALARELAELDWPLVHRLRKEVQDKLGHASLGEAAERWRQEWTAIWMGACQKQGVNWKEAEFWWHSIESHGGYSFNKSHCTTYGLIGYWMLYMKAHYPAAFYEAYLQLDDDKVTIKRLIGEFRAIGGRVELLDPVHSQAQFSSPREGLLVGGYRNILGIGEKVAAKIMDKAPFSDWDDLLCRGLPKALGSKLRAARDEQGWKPQETIQLAPWYPVQRLDREQGQTRQDYRIEPLGKLPEHAVDGDVMVVGYITITEFKHDKIIFVLEDETRPIVARVSRRHSLTENGRKFKTLEPGDFIATTGWWTGQEIYVKDYVILKPKPKPEPKATKKEKQHGVGDQAARELAAGHSF